MWKQFRITLLTCLGVLVASVAVCFNYNNFVVGYWSPPAHVRSGTIPQTGVIFRDPVTKTGQLHGWSEMFYPNGKTCSRTLYINGQWGGKSSCYLEDGSLNIQVTDFYLFKRVIRRQNDGTYTTRYSLF